MACYVHFSFDNYDPHLMQLNPETGNYEYLAMCPSNAPIMYFFTIDRKHKYIRQHGVQQIIPVDKDIQVRFSDVTLRPLITRMNYLKLPQEKSTRMFDSRYQKLFRSVPRVPESYIWEPLVEKAKKVWRFEDSIFKDYRRDDEYVLDMCFEEDWSNSKIPKVIPHAEHEDARLILRQYYQQIKNAYKQFASVSPNGNHAPPQLLKSKKFFITLIKARSGPSARTCT